MKQQFEKYGIPLTDKQEDQFKKLLELFINWNLKMNLSAIRDEEEIIKKHFIDSCLATKHFDFSGKNILDLGAGGGFPTLPLAIITGAQITALDSVNKKLSAVQAMADKLELHVTTVHGRAEDLGKDTQFREQFDVVVSRAVAPWPVLLELCLPFVKIEGSFIAYQGPAIKEDLDNCLGIEQELGGSLESVIEDELDQAERVFVEIFKAKNTPSNFPRKVGEAKRNPLG